MPLSGILTATGFFDPGRKPPRLDRQKGGQGLRNSGGPSEVMHSVLARKIPRTFRHAEPFALESPISWQM